MSQDHQPPKLKDDDDDDEFQFRKVNLPSQSYDKINFYDVTKDVYKLKKENTCQNCRITFENFQVLLGHKCLPYKCAICSTAFLHDYKFNMHQCQAEESNRNASKTHSCKICKKIFTEKSALLKHKKCCEKKKLCANCGKKLPVKSVRDFCHQCFFELGKNQDYSLRRNSKFRAAASRIEENGNGLHSVTDGEEVDGQNKMQLNDFDPAQNNLKRKKRSLDGSYAENSYKKKSSYSLTHRDSSIDNFEAEEDIQSNLEKVFVNALRKTSEKKRSSLSSDSNKDLREKISKTGVLDSLCNGIATSYNGITTSSKEISASSKPNSRTESIEKLNQTSLPPLRKSKRNLHKIAKVNSSTEDSVEVETEKLNVEESKTSEVVFPNFADSENNVLGKEKRVSCDHESVDNSFLVNNKTPATKTSSSKPSVENSKDILKKSSNSSRQSSAKKLPCSRNEESPKLRDCESSSDSVRSSLRKSKRKAIKNGNVTNLAVNCPVQKNEETCLDVEKKKTSDFCQSVMNNRKKRNGRCFNKDLSHEDPAVTESFDDSSRLSTSSSKSKKNTFPKISTENSTLVDLVKNRKAKASNEISETSSKKNNRNIIKATKNTGSCIKSTLALDNKIGNMLETDRNLFETSVTSKARYKNKVGEKAQKELTQPRKVKSRRASPNSAKPSTNALKLNSRNKNSSSPRNTISSIDYTPELVVSESTLNTVPDVLFSTSYASKKGLSSTNFNKHFSVSDSKNDTIKLESLMNVLPDGDSGLLLRVPSNTTDNYRCLKCNKLFKTIKMASTHYGDCKTNRVKRTTAVFLKDILWICLRCNFYCNQMSELSFHRQSCSNSSNKASIDNYFGNYNSTCMKYCAKCSFSCISSITFEKHPCKQRIEHMAKCSIDLGTIPKDTTIKKYECKYCESTFLNSNAYNKHIEKHRIESDERAQAIKQEPLEATEDYLKRLLEPLCSDLNSKKHSLSSILSSLMPEKDARTLENDSNPRNTSFIDISKSSSIFEENSNLSFSSDMADLKSQVSDKTWRTYLKDYSCRCKKHENATEEKPCLACLNAYIKKKGSVSCQTDSCTNAHTRKEGDTSCKTDSCTQTDPSTENDTTSFADTSADYIPAETAAMSGVTCEDALDECAPIIASVSSCNSELPVNNASDDDISDNPYYSSSLLPNSPNSSFITGIEDEKFPSQASPDSIESKLFINIILILKGNFVDSKYTIEKHNNLVKSIYKLKFGKLAEPHCVHPDQYYLLTECISKPGDKSSKFSEFSKDEELQNYFLIDRPFTDLMPLFVSQEPCDFDVVLCNNYRYNHYIFHLSWQLAPGICYSAYCVTEPTGIKFICGLCDDPISIHLLIEHFDKRHEGACIYNILIS